MNFFSILVQRFIDFCEIPEMYEGIYTNSLTIFVIHTAQSRYGMIVDCADSALANKIISHRSMLIATIERLNLATIQITVKSRFFREFCNSGIVEDINPWEIVKDWLLQESSKSFVLNTKPMKNLEFDLSSLYDSTYPVYIIAMHNQKLLFANQTALIANQKNSDEFIGENIACLCYPDELEKMSRMLLLDKTLTDYKYKAMNWHKDENIWRRREVELMLDVQIIDFGGVECRISIDKMVEETNRFVD